MYLQKREKRSVQMIINVTPSLKEKLNGLKDLTELSFNEIINQILEQNIDEYIKGENYETDNRS